MMGKSNQIIIIDKSIFYLERAIIDSGRKIKSIPPGTNGNHLPNFAIMRMANKMLESNKNNMFTQQTMGRRETGLKLRVLLHRKYTYIYECMYVCKYLFLVALRSDGIDAFMCMLI